ncbi:MAG: hypothetical protein NTZ09_06010, partial [Candidatus Hydrogenedentes bacterium]|nr:hypothetical protein [Candidatus Hydrogenedentota bacterium]
MKTSLKPVVVSLLFVAVLGVAAGPAHSTTEATRVSDLGGGKIVAMLPWNGGLWLGVEDGQHGEIWFSDGTAAGTVQVKELPETTVQDHWMTIGGVTEAGNGLIFDYLEVYDFFGWPNLAASSIWLSDGTDAGTAMLPISENTYTSYVGKLGNITYFGTSDYSFDVHNFWRSDGTLGGTYVLKPDLHANGGRELDNVMYFYGAPSSGTRPSLWRTDGTAEGTYTLQPGGGSCYSLVEMGGILYFVNGFPGGRLFRSDGTVEATYTLQPGGGTCDGFLVMENVLYFPGETNTGVPGLFRSDGTVSGTYRIAEISPERFYTGESVVLGDTAIFDVVVSGSHSLWRTDGTSEGTIRLMYGYAQFLTVFGGAVYFLADETGGTGLWKTDGTTAGTGFVFDADLWGDINMVAIDGQLLFWCQLPAGADLYTSDGTAAGTVLVDTPWQAEKQLRSQNAEVTAAGTVPVKNLPPPPISEIWS